MTGAEREPSTRDAAVRAASAEAQDRKVDLPGPYPSRSFAAASAHLALASRLAGDRVARAFNAGPPGQVVRWLLKVAGQIAAAMNTGHGG